MDKTELDKRVLQVIRGSEGPIRAGQILVALEDEIPDRDDRGVCRERQLDKSLQRLRKRGQIRVARSANGGCVGWVVSE